MSSLPRTPVRAKKAPVPLLLAKLTREQIVRAAKIPFDLDVEFGAKPNMVGDVAKFMEATEGCG